MIALPLAGYIDPGSGSMLFQVLVAGILSLGLALKSVRHSIVAFVKGLFGAGRRGRSEAGDSSDAPR